jgi:hypothetical protein
MTRSRVDAIRSHAEKVRASIAAARDSAREAYAEIAGERWTPKPAYGGARRKLPPRSADEIQMLAAEKGERLASTPLADAADAV